MLDHAAVMNTCDEKAQRLGIAALTNIERVIYLVSRANFEIELGGVSSFYFNSAGDLAEETVTALEAVGAATAAAALRKANEIFPAETLPNRERRYDAWKAIPPGGLEFCDAGFSAEDPDVFSKLCLYIDRHQKEVP